MSPDKDDVSKSESRSEGTATSEGGTFSTSEGRVTGTSETAPPADEVITPETHRPEDLNTHQHIAGATAPGKSTWIERMRSLGATIFGDKK